MSRKNWYERTIEFKHNASQKKRCKECGQLLLPNDSEVESPTTTKQQDDLELLLGLIPSRAGGFSTPKRNENRTAQITQVFSFSLDALRRKKIPTSQ